MYDLTYLGDSMNKCNTCGQLIESGFFNIYAHSLVCEKQTWPVDPNAPVIKKRRSIGFLGFNQNSPILICDVSSFGKSEHAALIERLGIPESMGIIKEMTESEIKTEFGINLPPLSVPEIMQIKAPELKLEVMQPYIIEDNRNSSGKISPREQRNREKFMKRRK